MSAQPLTLQPPCSEGTGGGKDHRGPAAQPLRASQLAGQSEQKGHRGDKKHRPHEQHDSPSQAWRWDSSSNGDRVLIECQLRPWANSSGSKSHLVLSTKGVGHLFTAKEIEAQRAKGQPKITQQG